MFRVSLSDAIGIGGIVFGLVIVALDKAGRLRGPVVPTLLIVAALLTLSLALGNAWVTNAPSGFVRFTRGALTTSFVGVLFSALAIWVAPISAAADGKPPEGFRDKVPETVYFSLGGGGITMGVSVKNLEKSTLLNLGGQVPVKLHLDGKGVLYCDVTIWGGLGKRPPIQVIRNELTVTPPQWDRNFSANAVEVVDEHGLPVFQLIRKDPSHYVLNGIMPHPGGGLIVATERGTAVVGGPTLAIGPNTLRPIFKYPSWKYLGQYAE